MKQGENYWKPFGALQVNFIFFAIKMETVNLFCGMVLAESARMHSLRRICQKGSRWDDLFYEHD